MANKEKLVSVGNVSALVDQIPGLAVMAYNPLGDLEDVKARAGSFKNAGEGWNTFTFPDSFDAPPTVYCQADGYSVEVKSVTAEGFLYRVLGALSAGSLKVTTGSYKVMSSSYSAITITPVTAVTLTAGSQATVADAVTVNYLAISYGGE